MVLYADVSIHARARRATTKEGSAAAMILFQFTPAHDGRLCDDAARRSARTFQFTPAHDGRLRSPADLGRGRCFNSRPRTTGDRWRPHARAPRSVSIHARARRATSARLGILALGIVSIHARARRATPTSGTPYGLCGFNSRPRTTGDPGFSARLAPTNCFNSRPRTTGDRLRGHPVPPHVHRFNSRPRTTGD